MLLFLVKYRENIQKISHSHFEFMPECHTIQKRKKCVHIEFSVVVVMLTTILRIVVMLFFWAFIIRCGSCEIIIKSI